MVVILVNGGGADRVWGFEWWIVVVLASGGDGEWWCWAVVVESGGCTVTEW